MFVIVAVLFAALASPFQVADSTATAAPAAGPLREVVYRFSYDSRVERSYGDFGAAAPQTGESSGGYSGKVVVDVMRAASDGLLVHVTETTNAENGAKPIAADIVVLTDGSLKIISGSYDQGMTMLLPYFGENCFGSNTLHQGDSWTTSSTTADGVAITSNFTVANVSGDEATVTLSAAPTNSKAGSAMNVDTKVVYKASLLVPLSLSVVIRGAGQNTISANQIQDEYHFDRISDTRDVPPSS
jgi:hypothetical protein